MQGITFRGRLVGSLIKSDRTGRWTWITSRKVTCNEHVECRDADQPRHLVACGKSFDGPLAAAIHLVRTQDRDGRFMGFAHVKAEVTSDPALHALFGINPEVKKPQTAAAEKRPNIAIVWQMPHAA